MKKGFTLIELLVVMSILTILATTAVVILNPVEYLRQSRDTKRIGDLETIDNAISASLANSPNLVLAPSVTAVYISLPDTASTTCGSYVLPTLPSPWQYRCATTANFRKTNGTGWLPIDFDTLPTKSPLATLPIDPSNNGAKGLYYAYVIGGSFEVTTAFESQKYFPMQYKDSGDNAGLYEKGSNVALFPQVARGVASYDSCAAIKTAYADAPDGPYVVNKTTPMSTYCDMTTDGGGWTLITTGMIASVGNTNSITTQSIDSRGGMIISSTETGTSGCVLNHADQIVLTSAIPWTKVRADYEFTGGNSCWALFGASGFNAVPTLTPFALGTDTIRNQVKMGGSAGNNYDGVNMRCDNVTQNFWHSLHGPVTRNAQVISRRANAGVPSGLSTGIACSGGIGGWKYQNIFIK